MRQRVTTDRGVPDTFFNTLLAMAAQSTESEKRDHDGRTSNVAQLVKSGHFRWSILENCGNNRVVNSSVGDNHSFVFSHC